MDRTYDVALVDGGNNGRRYFAVHGFRQARQLDGRLVGSGVAFGYAGTVRLLRDRYTCAAGIFVCGDRGAARRRAIDPTYKSKRRAKPWADLDRYLAQDAEATAFLALCGVSTVYRKGEEADDVLATLARRYERAGRRVLLVTNDHDLLQLVTERVHVLRSLEDRHVRFDPAKVLEETGFPPGQLLDYMTLRGDPGDEVPSPVPGIGEKAAAELLRRYPTVVAEVLAGRTPAEAFVRGDAPTRIWNLLSALTTEAVRRTRALVQLYDVEGLTFHRPRRDPAALRAATERLAFHSLLTKDIQAELLGPEVPRRLSSTA